MRDYIRMVALGVLGFAVAWGAWHLYLDHLTVDQVRVILAQPQQAQRPSPAPVSPSTP